MADPVRLGNVITKIQKCGADHDLGEGYGLLEQFIQLTPKEALAGRATRRCPIYDKDIAVNIEVDDQGYCTAECLGVGCEHLRG